MRGDYAITVALFPVDGTPHLAEVGNNLASLQALVAHGRKHQLIQVVPLAGGPIPGLRGLQIICNEEGKLPPDPLPANRRLGYDVIHGDFFVCRSEGAEFASLRPGDLEPLGLLFHCTVEGEFAPEGEEEGA